jgi:hypothetical protein
MQSAKSKLKMGETVHGFQFDSERSHHFHLHIALNFTIVI